jgi:hypothetical protein
MSTLYQATFYIQNKISLKTAWNKLPGCKPHISDPCTMLRTESYILILTHTSIWHDMDGNVAGETLSHLAQQFICICHWESTHFHLEWADVFGFLINFIRCKSWHKLTCLPWLIGLFEELDSWASECVEGMKCCYCDAQKLWKRAWQHP